MRLDSKRMARIMRRAGVGPLEVARWAEVSPETVRNALRGKQLQKHTARRIAAALDMEVL